MGDNVISGQYFFSSNDNDNFNLICGYFSTAFNIFIYRFIDSDSSNDFDTMVSSCPVVSLLLKLIKCKGREEKIKRSNLKHILFYFLFPIHFYIFFSSDQLTVTN